MVKRGWASKVNLKGMSHWVISLQQAEQLRSGDDGNTEHLVGSDLGMTARADESPQVPSFATTSLVFVLN